MFISHAVDSVRFDAIFTLKIAAPKKQETGLCKGALVMWLYSLRSEGNDLYCVEWGVKLYSLTYPNSGTQIGDKRGAS